MGPPERLRRLYVFLISEAGGHRLGRVDVVHARLLRKLFGALARVLLTQSHLAVFAVLADDAARKRHHANLLGVGRRPGHSFRQCDAFHHCCLALVELLLRHLHLLHPQGLRDGDLMLLHALSKLRQRLAGLRDRAALDLMLLDQVLLLPSRTDRIVVHSARWLNLNERRSIAIFVVDPVHGLVAPRPTPAHRQEWLDL